MLDQAELALAAQTMLTDEQLADYMQVDIEEIREVENYRIVKSARSKTLVFVRNQLLMKAQSGDQEALTILNRQIFDQ